MDFKKATQTAWIVLAALFILALFRIASAEAVYISNQETMSFFRINKLTGEVFVFDMRASKAWVKVSDGTEVTGKNISGMQ